MKFRGNIKIPQKRANSAAQLEILRPAENCGPYRLYMKHCSQSQDLNELVNSHHFNQFISIQ